MRTWTETRREGTDVGPIDWEHQDAWCVKLRPEQVEWLRAIEANPKGYRWVSCGGFATFEILSVRMYDGWPYWRPGPAVLMVGPMGSGEWRWADSLEGICAADRRALWDGVSGRGREAT